VKAWDAEEAAALLVASGRVAMRHYETPSASFKADRSVVTQADTEIEALLGAELDRPNEGVFMIGEETCSSRDEKYIEGALAGRAWIIDPIDGTAPYAHHVPTWGISIGYAEGGVIAEGGIFLPVTGEMFVTDGPRVRYACCPGGERAWDLSALGDIAITKRPLDDGGLIAISQTIAKHGTMDVANPVHALCCAVVPMTYLCLGRYLAYVGILNLWDFAAGLAIVRACGFVTRFLGGGDVTGRIRADCRIGVGGLARWLARDHIVFAPSDEIAEFVAAKAARR